MTTSFTNGERFRALSTTPPGGHYRAGVHWPCGPKPLPMAAQTNDEYWTHFVVDTAALSPDLTSAPRRLDPLSAQALLDDPRMLVEPL